MAYSPFSFNPQSTGTSEALVTNYTNASSITALSQAQACSINGSGQLVPLDVSSQASWDNFVGYAYVRIPASSTGPIVANGRLQNFTTAYAVGTPIYIDTNGNPTNIVPVIGTNGFVSGDAVILMGVLVPNENNPLDIDIAIFTQVFGTL